MLTPPVVTSTAMLTGNTLIDGIGQLHTRIGIRRTGGLLAYDASGGAVVPRLIGRGATHARVALVGGQALLLGGDHVEISIDVGPGCTLELEEIAGTIAYNAHDAPSSFAVRVAVGAGARFVWSAMPFVVADGANVRKGTSLRLDVNALAVLRESLVLGRVAERGGRATTILEARDFDDAPVHVEHLVLDGARPTTVGLGQARVLDTVQILGCYAPDSPVPVLDLERPGSIARFIGMEAHRTDLQPVWDAWSAHVLGAGSDRGRPAKTGAVE